jgi:AraC-like DNA-binding protein
MAFLPAGCKYAVRAARQTALLLLRPEEPLRLCDCLRLEDLDAPDPHTPRPDALRLGPDSRRVLRTLAGAMDAGCACRCLALAAIRELLVLLRWEYRPEQLAAFFGPAAGQDAAFAAFVLRNALLYHTAGDLAQAMNYSLSGFEKRFRRVFGTSPYRWMLRKKADAVYHELLAGTLDFDRIADLYGFASQQHFSAFVAGMLGGTPSAIRHAGGKWREFIKDG